MFSSIESVFALLRGRSDTAGAAARRILRSADPLDIDMLPDYLKRDIGLLDGRGPRPQPELYR